MTDKKYYAAVVACARWEENYIVEWVEYYKCIGYDHIYLYCNDDDPKPLFEKLFPFLIGVSPFVTFIHFKYQGLQYQMYMHFILNYRTETEWVSFFDIDEFLRITDGRLIGQFLSSYAPDIDCVLFNWLVFGTSGHKIAPTGKVLENYTRTSGSINEYTKFICRSAILDDGKLYIPDSAHGFWHNLQDKLYRDVKIVNVLGDSTHPFRIYNETTSRKINEIAALHHYMMKSQDYALHRVARGTGGAFGAQSMWNINTPEGQKALADLERFDVAEDKSLVDFWKKQLSNIKSAQIAPRPKGHLLSRNAPCVQSSLSEWSIGDSVNSDAQNATNGVINGREKFHTNLEFNPWWQIDLTRDAEVIQIIIYNVSTHTQFRFKNFKIYSCLKPNSWFEVFSKNDDKPVGSLLTQPFILEFNPPMTCRHIRIVLIGKEHLHLDQVEIYGNFLST